MKMDVAVMNVLFVTINCHERRWAPICLPPHGRDLLLLCLEFISP